MDRRYFLELTQIVSKYPNDIVDIKKDLPDKLCVRFKERKLYPVGYMLSYIGGKAIHTAILHDMNANSVVYASLNDIEKY